MTADLEAVTQTLASRREQIAKWLCDHGTGALYSKNSYLARADRFIADVLAPVLASLPDDRLAEAEAKVARVEALHRPDGGVSGPGAMCVECTPDFGTPFEDPVSWPCPTIAALSDKGEDAC